ncbi:hypothetical protein MSAN_02268500 [Mycena sanguinolenta]|uniref:EthD domain-containing protein n=1 Tax=Mycena sanguinolenta TaxID=230812 RepID=A0A8H7CHB8_9AGAR|nr:hypothetical protein MSAN_02268500 [Mycena sanguinolenta]
MSASYSKDRDVGIGIWQAPPNLSKEAFENKLTAMVDKLVALPIVQENYVKFEMMFQTGLGTEELMTHGLSEGPPSVWVTVECATIADHLEGWEDPAVMSVLQEGINSVYGDSRPTAHLSSGEVQTRLDRPTAGNRTRLACGLQRPDNISVDGYRKTVSAAADRFVSLPIVQQNVIKHSMWVPHNVLDSQMSAVGFSAPNANIIIMFETENQDSMIEILKDPDVKEFVDDSRHKWDIHFDSSFVANVVTKIEK